LLSHELTKAIIESVAELKKRQAAADEQKDKPPVPTTPPE